MLTRALNMDWMTSSISTPTSPTPTGHDLPKGYKVFPSIRASGDSAKRLSAMVKAGQKVDKGLAIGSVVELLLLCDVANPKQNAAPSKTNTCYAELTVSVGEPSYFWKVRTQPAEMSCCTENGGDILLETAGFKTMTMWDDRLVTISEEGELYNYITGSRRAFKMNTILESADGVSSATQASGLPPAWAAVHGEELMIGAMAGFDPQAEVRTVDADFAIKHLAGWEQKYRALNLKATVCRGRKPADVTCTLWSAMHSKWFMILKSRDTMDTIHRFVAADKDFKVIDAWDLPQAGPQDVTAMLFVPNSGDSAVLIFRGQPPETSFSTVWSFTIMGEVLMSGVDLDEGVIVRGAAVTAINLAPADGGANPLSATESGLEFLKDPSKMVEIEYDEEEHVEYDHLVEVERDVPVQVLRKHVIQETDLEMPADPPSMYAKSRWKSRVWRNAAQGNPRAVGNDGAAETPLGPVAVRLLCGVPGTEQDMEKVLAVLEYETALGDLANIAAGNDGDDDAGAGAGADADASSAKAGGGGGGGGSSSSRGGGAAAGIATSSRPRRVSSSVGVPNIAALSEAMPDWSVGLFKEAATRLLDGVRKAAAKRKKKASTTLADLHKMLWYTRHSVVCTAAKLLFYGKVFQLVRELNMHADRSSGVTKDAVGNAPDPTATISTTELVFALQLATKGALYKMGLLYCLSIFATPKSAPIFTFEQFWPIAAFAERLASRKDVLEPYLEKIERSTARHPNFHRALSLFYKNTVDGDPLLDLSSFEGELVASGMSRPQAKEVMDVAAAALVADGKLCFFDFLTILPVIFACRAKPRKR